MHPSVEPGDVHGACLPSILAALYRLAVAASERQRIELLGGLAPGLRCPPLQVLPVFLWKNAL
jgi:hypothetical protein